MFLWGAILSAFHYPAKRSKFVLVELSSLTLLANFVHTKINSVVDATCCEEVHSSLYSQIMLFDHKSCVSYNAISREMFAPLALARCMLVMSIANIISLCRVCGIYFSVDNSR